MFQGLIVAVLYCFLNSEVSPRSFTATFNGFAFFSPSPWSKVQSELCRMWRGLSLKRYVGRDYKLHGTSAGPNGTESSAQCPRSFRAPSILQTETSVLWETPLEFLHSAGIKEPGWCFDPPDWVLWSSLAYRLMKTCLIYEEAEPELTQLF